MNSNTKQILALVLVAVMVASAGCAGWGQDGPADNDPEQSNDSADLGQTQNESENQSDSNASDGPNQSGDSSSESDNDDPDSNSGGSDPTESQSDSSDDTSDSDSSDDTSEGDSKSGSSGSDLGDDGSSSGENGAANGEDSDTSDESPSAGDDSDDDDDKDDTQDGENDTPTDPNGDDTDPDAPDEGNTVTIDVIDLETDEPVEIPVRLTSGDFERTETATDGTATFENIPDGTYDIRPAADGWWKEYGDEAGITVKGDTSHTMGVNDELDSHTLTVTVTDAETGEPIEGARLSAKGGRHPSGADILIVGTTNSDGVATIDAYESGYIGNIDADGYEVSDTKSFNVDSDTSVSFELEPTDDGEPDIAPANAIDVESVKHGGAEPFTDYDRVTLVNTHDELPLDVSGWSISVSD